MKHRILLFSAFMFAVVSIIAPLSFVTAYVPPNEKNLLALDVADIANSEINVSYQAQIEVENSYQQSTKRALSIYIPYAIEDERQKVVAIYPNITLSNSTFVSTLTDCSCDTNINPYLCCEIVKKDDGKKLKITFNVPKGRFNTTYKITEDVKVNNSMIISSINKTSDANNESIIKYSSAYDEWANYDEEIKNFTINLTKNSSSDFEKVSKMVEWIYNNVEYDVFRAGMFQNASWTFKNKQGVCNHFTNLFLVMCRSINISARAMSGEIFNETQYISGHAWAEVFIDKWYPVDPTFGEIGLVDSGRVGFTQSISASTLLYFDMDPTYLSILSWGISSSDFGEPTTTEWENTINVSTNYSWINKTQTKDNITNGTLQITVNITRLNLSGAITGMISVAPPNTSSEGINVTTCEGGRPLNAYFLIPGDKNFTTVAWLLNFTNIDLNKGVNYMFPVIVHSFLSNATTVNVTTYPNFVINPSLKTTGTNKYQLNINVTNIGLRDGNTNVQVFLDNETYAINNLFVKGGSGTNFAIVNFTNVVGRHKVEIKSDGARFKFFIGNIENKSCKGDVNLNYEINLNDAFELIEFIGNARDKTNSMSANVSEYYENCNKPEDADNNNVTDIFDVVKILETISQ